MFNRTVLFGLLLVSMCPVFAASISPAQEAALRAVALDYVDGWYTGDAQRMDSALHPDLAKRALLPAQGGGLALDDMGKEQLVSATGQGFGTQTPADEQIRDIQILDVFGKAAVVRAEMSGWIDYLQLIQIEGEWKIINVLWELKPRPMETDQR